MHFFSSSSNISYVNIFIVQKHKITYASLLHSNVKIVLLGGKTVGGTHLKNLGHIYSVKTRPDLTCNILFYIIDIHFLTNTRQWFQNFSIIRVNLIIFNFIAKIKINKFRTTKCKNLKCGAIVIDTKPYQWQIVEN